MKVGFVGLGQMGGPMSLNLLGAGFGLTVHDIRRDAAAEQLRAGAVWAATPREAGSGRDVVVTMLPTPRHVEEVLLGAPAAGAPAAGAGGVGAGGVGTGSAGTDGLLDGLAAGAVWIDMSTSVPAVAERVRNLATPRRIHVLDAPVSGMAAGARAGTLQIFVGGDADTYQRVRPVLEAMGDPERILHVGPHGSGYTVKLMINSLWFAHLAATAEVLMTGVRAGVDLAMLRRALVASPANSNFVEHDVLSVLERGDYDDSFALALACKDLGLAVDLARDVGVPVEVSALVEQIYRRARAQYGDQGGEMLPVKLLEDVTGTQLRLAPSPP
jgi:3-hydroxyisobutyrate dehydrogenase